MKRYVRSFEEKKVSPKLYIKQIADEIGYKVPPFTDPAAGGYKMSYLSHTKAEAEEDLKKMTEAADKFGIKILRPQVKSGNKGTWIAYMVVPRYEVEDIESSENIETIKIPKTIQIDPCHKIIAVPIKDNFGDSYSVTHYEKMGERWIPLGGSERWSKEDFETEYEI